MGKLQSKHACKRRENPEGDAFKECICEVDRNKQDLCVRDPKVEHYCAPRVTLPAERIMENPRSLFSSPEDGRQHPLKDALRRNRKSDDKESNSSVMDENRREWTITLTDLDSNGKITRENMLSLMQTICEAVEVSVKRLVLSNGSSLRVKLSVTPLTSRKDGDAGMQSLNERDHMKETVRGLNSDQLGVLEKKLYSVDENTERRNHFLDLAGIENYASRFEETSPEEPPQESPARVHHRCSQPETCSPVESSGKPIPFLRSLRSRSNLIVDPADSMGVTL